MNTYASYAVKMLLFYVFHKHMIIKRTNFCEHYILTFKPFQNDVVSYLGSYTSPWVMEVSIQSGGSSRAQLLGNTTVTFEDGWANFTNLYITNRGDYVLQFNITEPPSAVNYSLVSPTVTVSGVTTVNFG